MAGESSASRPGSRSVKIGADERTAGPGSPAPRRRSRAPAEHLCALSRAGAGRPPALLAGQPRGRDLGLRARPRRLRGAADRGSRELAVAGQGARPAGGARARAEELEARAQELLAAAVSKRLENRDTVVLAAESLEAQERERFVRIAAALKRPRHLILLETARDQVSEEHLPDAQRAAPRARRRRAGRGGLSDRASPGRRQRRARSSGSCSALRRARTPGSFGRVAGLVLGFDRSVGRIGVVDLAEQRRVAIRAADQVVGRAVGQQAPLAGAEVDRLRVVGDSASVDCSGWARSRR